MCAYDSRASHDGRTARLNGSCLEHPAVPCLGIAVTKDIHMYRRLSSIVFARLLLEEISRWTCSPTCWLFYYISSPGNCTPDWYIMCISYLNDQLYGKERLAVVEFIYLPRKASLSWLLWVYGERLTGGDYWSRRRAHFQRSSYAHPSVILL